MRNFILSTVTMAISSIALAIPSPGAFSNAEVRAILENSEIEGWVILKIELTGYNKKLEGNGYSLTVETGGGPGKYCLTAVVSSEMAKPQGGARSSDEVIASVKTVSKPQACK